jgi:hypothetical protein
LLSTVEATVLVSVVENTVPPCEFWITTSALVISAAPNGSLTVNRTNAGCPASVVAIGDPPGNAAPKTPKELTVMPVAVANSICEGNDLLS